MGAALKRKGKGDDVTEEDMDPVVHAHNSAPSPNIHGCTVQAVQILQACLLLCALSWRIGVLR